jgi:hypothetical protein
VRISSQNPGAPGNWLVQTTGFPASGLIAKPFPSCTCVPWGAPFTPSILPCTQSAVCQCPSLCSLFPVVIDPSRHPPSPLWCNCAHHCTSALESLLWNHFSHFEARHLTLVFTCNYRHSLTQSSNCLEAAAVRIRSFVRTATTLNIFDSIPYLAIDSDFPFTGFTAQRIEVLATSCEYRHATLTVDDKYHIYFCFSGRP